MLLPCYFLSSSASSSSEHLQASQPEISSSSSFRFPIFSPVTAASNVQHKTNFSINNTYLSSFRSMIPQFLSSKLPGNDFTIAFFKLPGTDSTSHFSIEIKIYKVSRVLKMISTRARNGLLSRCQVFFEMKVCSGTKRTQKELETSSNSPPLLHRNFLHSRFPFSALIF
jgi:hypothetical protein